jgi:hypothetical protein
VKRSSSRDRESRLRASLQRSSPALWIASCPVLAHDSSRRRVADHAVSSM